MTDYDIPYKLFDPTNVKFLPQSQYGNIIMKPLFTLSSVEIQKRQTTVFVVHDGIILTDRDEIFVIPY